MARKSGGSLVNKQDVEANGLADSLAKRAVEYHRVPRSEVRRWAVGMKQTKARAKWIGMASYEANVMAEYPFSDSEASRWRVELQLATDGCARRVE